MIRSVVETVAQGCFNNFCTDMRHLNRMFQGCTDTKSLCTSCRLFGIMGRGTNHQGHVFFSDAICINSVPYDRIYTAILSGPDINHTAFYLDAAGNQIAGRKYYFHHSEYNLLIENELRRSGRGEVLNSCIQPLGIGSKFKFSVEFENIYPEDFNALIYSLILEDSIRHKIGLAKPCGLGSVQLTAQKLEIRDFEKRCKGDDWKVIYKEDNLISEISRIISEFTPTIPAITLEDLRRIWHWPPHAGVKYIYPSQGWFRANSDVPISGTP